MEKVAREVETGAEDGARARPAPTPSASSAATTSRSFPTATGWRATA